MEEFSCWGEVSPLLLTPFSPFGTEASLQPPCISPNTSDDGVDSDPLLSDGDLLNDLPEHVMATFVDDEAAEGGMEELDGDEAPYYEETPRQLVGYTRSGRPIYSVKRLLVPYPGKEHEEDMVEYSKLPSDDDDLEEESEEESEEEEEEEEESDGEYDDAKSETETETETESEHENEMY